MSNSPSEIPPRYDAAPDAVEGSPSENGETTEAAFRIFAQQLEVAWTRQRTPKQLKKKLLETRTTGDAHTARIFLNHGGFKAWLAYFLATEGRVHFKGRQRRSQIIADFNQLPQGERIKTAQRFTAFQPHETADKAILRIFESLSKLGLIKAPQNDSTQQRPIIEPQTDVQADSAITPESLSSIAQITTEEGQRVITNASLQGIAKTFDPYMSGAIRKISHQNDTVSTAAVTMAFPPWALLDCLMSLDVLPSKVQYLAMALFKVRVEGEGQVRFVSLKDGVRLVPNPELTLKGVQDEAISEVFGAEIHQAITACRMRKKELREGNNATECVSMILTSNYNEGAILNLALGLEEGIRIRRLLYT